MPRPEDRLRQAHVAKHLGEAVDKVNRQEHKELLAVMDDTLKGTKFAWLQNPENMKPKTLAALNALRDSTLRTAGTWAIKEGARGLWARGLANQAKNVESIS